MNTTNLKDYLLARIKRSNYRGAHVTQHNRLPFEKAVPLIGAIHSLVGVGKKFSVPPGDYRRNDPVPPEFGTYKAMVGKIHGVLGQGTINSVKKNLFVDLERMGFMKRGMQNACLMDMAGKLVSAQEESDARKIFAKGAKKLAGEKVMGIMAHALTHFGSVSVWEYMLILSDLSLPEDRAINLVKEYRALGQQGQASLRMEIQSKCKSAMAGPKGTKRDFGNWFNQADGTFGILHDTMCFMVYGKGRNATIQMRSE